MELHETHLMKKSDRRCKGYRLAIFFFQEVGYNKFGYSIMSSKAISASFQLIGVDGSIAIGVRSVLAQTGGFARFG
jgi:hypothetical protein